MTAAHTLVVDQHTFQTEVIEESRSRLVLVDFWAAWCGPCRVLGPVLEQLAAEAGGAWRLAKVDTQANPDLAQQHAIQSIPAVKAFVDGVVVDEFVGALGRADIARFIERLLPPDPEKLAEAEGEVARLQGLIAEQPDDRNLKLELGRALGAAGRWPEAFEQWLALVRGGGEHREMAKADLVATFQKLGRTDAVKEAQRALAMELYK